MLLISNCRENDGNQSFLSNVNYCLRVINNRRKQSYSGLKEKQLDVLKNLVAGRDVIAALKTGYGNKAYQCQPDEEEGIFWGPVNNTLTGTIHNPSVARLVSKMVYWHNYQCRKFGQFSAIITLPGTKSTKTIPSLAHICCSKPYT